MKAGAVRKLSGAEQRALREQIAAADPKAEAWAKESSFLRAVASAEEDLAWIVQRTAWTLLGFETFTAWWEARVPAGLGWRPAREIAIVVLAQLRADQEALPKAQRRTNKQLAALVGLSETSIRRVAPRSLPAPNGAGADLGQSPDVDQSVGAGTPAPAAPPRGTDCSTAPDREHCACGQPIPEDQQHAGTLRCPSCDPGGLHRAEPLGFDEGWGECTQCAREARQTAAEGADTTGADAGPARPVAPTGTVTAPEPVGDQTEERIEEEAVEGSDVDLSSFDAALLSADDLAALDTPAAAATSLPDGDGDLPLPQQSQQPGLDSPTDPFTAGRSETYLHLPHGGVGGEAPEAPASVEPVLEDGDAPAVPSPSSSDPDDEEWISPFVVVRLMRKFADDLDVIVDHEVMGPMFADDELAELHTLTDRIALHVGLIEKYRTP